MEAGLKSVSAGGTRQSRRSSVFFSVLLLLTILGFLSSKEAAIAQENSCVSGICHSTMGKGKFVHGPVAVGECTLCHVPIDKHTFTLAENIETACYICHEPMNTKNGVHEAVNGRFCTDCHDSHQSPNEFRLHTNIELVRTGK